MRMLMLQFKLDYKNEWVDSSLSLPPSPVSLSVPPWIKLTFFDEALFAVPLWAFLRSVAALTERMEEWMTVPEALAVSTGLKDALEVHVGSRAVEFSSWNNPISE